MEALLTRDAMHMEHSQKNMDLNFNTPHSLKHRYYPLNLFLRIEKNLSVWYLDTRIELVRGLKPHIFLLLFFLSRFNTLGENNLNCQNSESWINSSWAKNAGSSQILFMEDCFSLELRRQISHLDFKIRLDALTDRLRGNKDSNSFTGFRCALKISHH